MLSALQGQLALHWARFPPSEQPIITECLSYQSSHSRMAIALFFFENGLNPESWQFIISVGKTRTVSLNPIRKFYGNTGDSKWRTESSYARNGCFVSEIILMLERQRDRDTEKVHGISTEHSEQLRFFFENLSNFVL